MPERNTIDQNAERDRENAREAADEKAKAARTGPRAIVGAVRFNGALYTAGQEDALGKAMHGQPMQHMVDSGALTGDWPSDPTPRADASTQPGQPIGSGTAPARGTTVGGSAGGAVTP